MGNSARSMAELMDDFLSCYFSNWSHRQQGKEGDPVLAWRLLQRDTPDVEAALHLLGGVKRLQQAYGRETGSLRETDCIGLVVGNILADWYYLNQRMEVMELHTEVNYTQLDRWMVMISTPLRIMLRFAIEHALFSSCRGTAVTIGHTDDALVISWVADRGCKFSKRFAEGEVEIHRLHMPDPEEFEQWLRLPAEYVALRLIVLACDILDIDRPRRRFTKRDNQLVVEMHLRLPT